MEKFASAISEKIVNKHKAIKNSMADHIEGNQIRYAGHLPDSRAGETG